MVANSADSMKKESPNTKKTKNQKAGLSRKQLLEILTEIYSQLEDVGQTFEVEKTDKQFIIKLNDVDLVNGMLVPVEE